MLVCLRNIKKQLRVPMKGAPKFVFLNPAEGNLVFWGTRIPQHSTEQPSSLTQIKLGLSPCIPFSFL